MSASASPRSWQLGAGETLSLDATSSFDPDGTPLLFTWEVVPNTGVGISNSGPGLAEINFASPGIYTITITGTNNASQSTQLVRQAAVYSVSDFANFSDSFLPPLAPNGKHRGAGQLFARSMVFPGGRGR
jgi:hypothetical protein